jgi:radical SAM protein with 4Fe4S-binding SPASM domain
MESVSEFPLQIDFEINSTCQMRCGFCPHGRATQPRGYLEFEEFVRVIDEGEKNGLCSIKLNYINEPLLNRDLEKFVRYAISHGVLNVYFATNGMLLDERCAEWIIDSGVAKVMVSLDAATQQTFERIRKGGDLERIEKNIFGLLKKRNDAGSKFPLVRVNFLKTIENEHEASEFVAKWSGIADMVGFQDQVGLPGEDSELTSERSSAIDDFRCSFPYKMVVIDSSGKILPCCTFSGRLMPIGDLRSGGTVMDAWNSPAMKKLREEHASGSWGGNPVCLHCITGK